MKLKSAALQVAILSTGLLIFSGCTKSISEDSSPSLISSYSKNIPEIGLKINFDFQRTNPDGFRISLSDGFSIDQVNSLFNSDQQMEYFTVRLKKSDGAAYLLNGTVDAKGAITTSVVETISINN